MDMLSYLISRKYTDEEAAKVAAPTTVALTDDGKVFTLGTNDIWNQI